MRFGRRRANALIALLPTSFHGVLGIVLILNYLHINSIKTTFGNCSTAIKAVREANPDIPIVDLIRLPEIIAGCGTAQDLRTKIQEYLHLSADLYEPAVLTSSFFAAIFLIMITAETLYRRLIHRPAPHLLSISTIILALATIAMWVIHFYYDDCLGTGNCATTADYDQRAFARAADVSELMATLILTTAIVHLTSSVGSLATSCYNLGKHRNHTEDETPFLTPDESENGNLQADEEDEIEEQPSIYEQVKQRICSRRTSR
jgi:hypothetical protein